MRQHFVSSHRKKKAVQTADGKAKAAEIKAARSVECSAMRHGVENSCDHGKCIPLKPMTKNECSLLYMKQMCLFGE
jgi:hypothetical protein